MTDSSREYEFEKIENVPKTVRELLTEMKDISEVIVDLAYAALMFDSKEIGEEVKHLESTMDTLNYEIRIKAMLASRTPDDAIQLSGLLQVASAAEAISNAAGDVVDLLDTAIEKRPFLTFILRDAEEKIRMLILSNKSDMVSRTIEELSVESETGMRIIAIKRGKRWIHDPEDETKLKGGDLLIVRGTEDGFETLRQFTSAREKWPVEEEAD
ncbi:MAG TPA: TrkA C-terminal domain-containing protein [Methanomassiliicoccales archaeon]|nr:TrkA C-terminal domain-containing protein [Methanomassiliicoccales archaeon]